jgi:hypothetical protein
MKITKGGKLMLEVWEKQVKTDVDVSSTLFNRLLQTCQIEDGLVLKDLMILTQPYAQLLSPLFTSSPDWLEEIIDEGLNTPFKQDMEEMEFLQLSWASEVHQYGKDPKEIYEYVHFNGFGPPPPNDDNYKDWPVGQAVSWALDFSPVYTLTEIPLKLDPVLKMLDYTSKKVGQLPSVMVEAKKEFTLLDILKGVFWELSFHGSPKSRNERAEDLKMRVKDATENPEKSVLWEDVKAQLQAKYGKDDEGDDEI